MQSSVLSFVLVTIGLPDVVVPARAADYYLTPEGAGARTGRSRNDALAFSSIDETLNRTMKPGDTLHIEGARYGRVQIIIDSSGTAEAPKTIVGEDRGHGFPLFGPLNEEWMNWKEYGLLFKTGSSHWTVRNLQFRLYAEPTVCTQGGHTDLKLDNLRVRDCYTGFQFSDCDDSVVRNCSSTRYTQQGFFFVKHCDRVLVQNCEADGSPRGILPGDVTQSGFQCGLPKAPPEEGNTYLTFENCVARNNLDKDRGQSWVQGDGFLAENAERHMRFRGCRSFDASDGCFDLKAQIDEFRDCVAVGPARCFKLWSQTLTLTNCIAILTEDGRFRTTGTTSALEVNNRGANRRPLGGHIRGQWCTLCLRNPDRGYAVFGESAKVTLEDCILSFTSPRREGGSIGPYGPDVTAACDRTAIHWQAMDATAPIYIYPVENWQGRGSNYNSQVYGTSKGYHSSRVVVGSVTN